MLIGFTLLQWLTSPSSSATGGRSDLIVPLQHARTLKHAFPHQTLHKLKRKRYLSVSDGARGRGFVHGDVSKAQEFRSF